MTIQNRISPTIWEQATPLHLFDSASLEEDGQNVSKCFQDTLPQAKLFYSVKTNSLSSILRTLKKQNYGFEAITPGDLEILKKFKVPGDKIIFNGHARTKENFAQAIYEQNIKYIFIDSLSQISILESLVKDHGLPTASKFGLRINHGYGHFGLAPNSEEIREALKSLEKIGLPLYGLHFHNNLSGGEQIISKITGKAVHSLRSVLEQKDFIEGISKNKIQCLNLGGGLPSPHEFRVADTDLPAFWSEGKIPNSASTPRPSSKDVIQDLGKNLAQLLKEKNAENLEILFEPGRIIVARAMHTLLSIHAVKRNLPPNNCIWITDGNTLMLTSMKMGIYPLHLLKDPSKAKSKSTGTNGNVKGPTEKVSIYGNLPYEADLLLPNQNLPIAEAGDRLLVENTGAYFLPFEMNFGYPRPGIFEIDSGDCIREREKIENLSARDL